MVIQKQPQKAKSRRQDTKVKMNIDLRTFNILCRYVLTVSSYLRISHLINLSKLIYSLDPSTYENDPDKFKRVKFITKGLEARINYNLNDLDMILNHIFSGLDFDVDFIDLTTVNLTADEIMWVHNMVSESLQYYFVYDYSDALLDICTRIKSSDYSHRGELIRQFESMVDDLKNKFRTSKPEDSLTDMTFSLREGIFERSVTETYNLITNPSRRLITGMQGFNEMIGGGFESGRVYMLLGITGIGKSITLLNLVYQLKIYNRHYKTKDPTKTPCIVLLTMENTVVETITRLFDLAVENSQGMGNYPVEEVIRKLKTEGKLSLTDDSPIDIVIKYKPNKSVDTSYLYTMVDDLEDDGYEVIGVVQDHVKRIRSIYNSPDIRIELGDIVNEFKVFAADRDIPVITNSHLNRDAARIIEDDGAKASRSDVTMKLGKANAGESLLMLDNLDGAIIINLDFDEDNNKYMAFKKAKMREKTDRDYILQPFVYGSGIRLVEDLYGEPMFKEYLHMNHEINRMNNVRTTSTNVMNNINNVMMNNQNQNSAFGNMNTKYLIESEFEEIPKDEFKRATVIRPIRFEEEPENKPSMIGINELKEKLAERKIS